MSVTDWEGGEGVDWIFYLISQEAMHNPPAPPLNDIPFTNPLKYVLIFIF